MENFLLYFTPTVKQIKPIKKVIQSEGALSAGRAEVFCKLRDEHLTRSARCLEVHGTKTAPRFV